MLKMVKCQKNRQAIPFFSKTLPSPVARFHLLLQQIRVFFRFSGLQLLQTFRFYIAFAHAHVYQSWSSKSISLSCLSRVYLMFITSYPFWLITKTGPASDQRPAPGAARPRGRAGLPHIKASPGLAPQGFQLLVRLFGGVDRSGKPHSPQVV